MEYSNGTSLGGGLPSFDDDNAADKWLRLMSPFYLSMAKQVEERGGYAFRNWNQSRGIVVHENGTRYIQLGDDLKGSERISVLIFEMTNAFQAGKHIEIDQR